MTTTGLDLGALWVVIVAVIIGTYAFRLSFLLLSGWIGDFPPRLEAALRFVPAAVLAGLAFPAFVYLDGSLALSPGNERLIAGGVATVVAWRTENMLATIAVGMATLWFLGAVL